MNQPQVQTIFNKKYLVPSIGINSVCYDVIFCDASYFFQAQVWPGGEGRAPASPHLQRQEDLLRQHGPSDASAPQEEEEEEEAQVQDSGRIRAQEVFYCSRRRSRNAILYYQSTSDNKCPLYNTGELAKTIVFSSKTLTQTVFTYVSLIN